MDRRGDERFPLVREVLLCCHSFGLVKGTTLDISSNGVFVSTRFLSLIENTNVDVCFMSENKNEKCFHKISAKVARVNGTGIGLHFTQDLPNEFLAVN